MIILMYVVITVDVYPLHDNGDNDIVNRSADETDWE
jgi:hypothetical protein